MSHLAAVTRESVPDFDLYAELEVSRLASVAVIDASMQVATLTEVVNVRAQTSNALVVPTGQTNLTARELNTIPVGAPAVAPALPGIVTTSEDLTPVPL